VEDVVDLGPSAGRRSALVITAGASALLCLGAAFVCFTDVVPDDLRALGWLAIAAAGALGAVAVLVSRWQASADVRGITSRTLGTRFIPWNRVRVVSVRRVLQVKPGDLVNLDQSRGMGMGMGTGMGMGMGRQRGSGMSGRHPDDLSDRGLRLVVVLVDDSEVALPVRVGAGVASERGLVALAKALDELNRSSSGGR
jgi:hypothetical protein